MYVEMFNFAAAVNKMLWRTFVTLKHLAFMSYIDPEA